MWGDDSGKGKLYSLSYILSYLDKLHLFCCKLQEDTLGQNPTFKLCAPRFILTRLTNQMKRHTCSPCVNMWEHLQRARKFICNQRVTIIYETARRHQVLKYSLKALVLLLSYFHFLLLYTCTLLPLYENIDVFYFTSFNWQL